MKLASPSCRLMILNMNDEDPTELVQRYLEVARAKLGFPVNAVWCSPADFKELQTSVVGIRVIATSHCPARHFQLGNHIAGGESNASATDPQDHGQRSGDRHA